MGRFAGLDVWGTRAVVEVRPAPDAEETWIGSNDAWLILAPSSVVKFYVGTVLRITDDR